MTMQRPPVRTDTNAAFTLLEVTLAVAVGILLLAGITSMFRMYGDQARINQAKTNLATLRNNISMYKYRTGNFPPSGFVGTITSVVAPSTLTITLGTGTLPASAPYGYITQAGGSTTEITNVAGATLTVTSTTGFTSGSEVLSGLVGNVDDQGQPFLSVPAPGATPAGMGLEDPWLAYQDVRDITQTAANLDTNGIPCFTGLSVNDPRGACTGFAAGAAGFEYNSGRTTDVWGGLAYDPGHGEVYYVLPDPISSPPANLGNFPGDPPVSWGK